MADYSREAVLERSSKGESLERADLRDIVLSRANLERANLRRADLEGVNFEDSNLRNANLSSANLRDAYLANADLEGANLQKTDLEGANLQGTNLKNADLTRANLEGANLEGANLTGARLTFAQLEQANLGGATLERVEFVNADLRDAYLGGANFTNADLKHAQMENANFEEANLTEADFRNAKLRGAKFTRTTMTGVKLYGCELDVDRLVHVVADWVDFSEFADGVAKCPGELFAEQYQQMKNSGAFSKTSQAADQGKRFFGRGDVLRNAALEFGDKSQVEIESRFENCTISLGSGAVLKLGKHGVLHGCQIVGFGEIDIAGEFRENGKGPGIVGPKRIIVRKDGVVSGSVQQPPTMTEFAFENGCHLQLKIQK
jgi:uncharacterized protein YjbI with pentapeptide repeats